MAKTSTNNKAVSARTAATQKQKKLVLTNTPLKHVQMSSLTSKLPIAPKAQRSSRTLSKKSFVAKRKGLASTSASNAVSSTRAKTPARSRVSFSTPLRRSFYLKYKFSALRKIEKSVGATQKQLARCYDEIPARFPELWSHCAGAWTALQKKQRRRFLRRYRRSRKKRRLPKKFVPRWKRRRAPKRFRKLWRLIRSRRRIARKKRRQVIAVQETKITHNAVLPLRAVPSLGFMFKRYVHKKSLQGKPNKRRRKIKRPRRWWKPFMALRKHRKRVKRAYYRKRRERNIAAARRRRNRRKKKQERAPKRFTVRRRARRRKTRYQKAKRILLLVRRRKQRRLKRRLTRSWRLKRRLQRRSPVRLRRLVRPHRLVQGYAVQNRLARRALLVAAAELKANLLLRGHGLSLRTKRVLCVQSFRKRARYTKKVHAKLLRRFFLDFGCATPINYVVAQLRNGSNILSKYIARLARKRHRAQTTRGRRYRVGNIYAARALRSVSFRQSRRLYARASASKKNKRITKVRHAKGRPVPRVRHTKGRFVPRALRCRRSRRRRAFVSSAATVQPKQLITRRSAARSSRSLLTLGTELPELLSFVSTRQNPFRNRRVKQLQRALVYKKTTPRALRRRRRRRSGHKRRRALAYYLALRSVASHKARLRRRVKKAFTTDRPPFLIWPHPEHTRADHWVSDKRQFYKMKQSSLRTTTSTIFPSHQLQVPNELPVTRLSDNTLRSEVLTAKRATRVFNKNRPSLSPVYSLRFRRWHSRRDAEGNPIPRVWPTAAELKLRASMNIKRARRGLPYKKMQDPVYRELELETGFPAVLGYRRLRRQSSVKFNHHRTSEANNHPTPWQHPFSLLRPLGSWHNSPALLRRRWRSEQYADKFEKGPNYGLYFSRYRLAEQNAWREFDTGLKRTSPSKRALITALGNLSRKGFALLRRRANFSLLKAAVPIWEESFSKPYKEGLTRFARSKKLLRKRWSQPKYEGMSAPLMTAIEKSPFRFPAAGRNYASYDDAVRVFRARTAQKQFRRTQPLIYPRLDSALSVAPRTRMEGVNTRKGSINLTPAPVGYLTEGWRRLLVNKRACQTKLKSGKRLTKLEALSLRQRGSHTKRRSLSLPLEENFDEEIDSKDFVRDYSALTAGFNNEALLTEALREREQDSAYTELQTKVDRRLAPEEQILPPWMYERSARKEQEAVDVQDYELPRMYEARHAPYWLMHDMTVYISSLLPPTESGVLPTGEFLSNTLVVERPNWAFRGWSRTNKKNIKARARIHNRVFSAHQARRKSRGRFSYPYIIAVRRKLRNLSRKRRYHRFSRAYSYKMSRKYRSALRRPGWRARKRRRRLRLRLRGRVIRHFRQRPIKLLISRQLARRREQLARRFTTRVVTATHPVARWTPLHFKLLTRNAAKLKKRAADRPVALDQDPENDQFVETLQLTTAITNMFPQLMGQLIERHLSGRATDAKVLRGLVTSAYWSLRMLLSFDHKKTRWNARVRNQSRLLALRGQFVSVSKEERLNPAALATIRDRFQPLQIVPGPSLERGALDWLHVMFPRYYDLQQEDPDYYADLALMSSDTLRARPLHKKTLNWQTDALGGLDENRLSRLTAANNSEGFENALRTTRRSLTTIYTATKASRAVKSAGKPRTPFFKRGFTTCACRNSADIRDIVTARLQQLQRQTLNEEAPFPAAEAVSARLQYQLRADGRNKLNYAEETPSGALDPRLLRSKSPRNQQYLQRGLQPVTHTEMEYNRARLNARRVSAEATFRVYRTARSSRRPAVLPTAGRTPVLRGVRNAASIRRLGTTKRARAIAAAPACPARHSPLSTKARIALKKEKLRRERVLVSLRSLSPRGRPLHLAKTSALISTDSNALYSKLWDKVKPTPQFYTSSLSLDRSGLFLRQKVKRQLRRSAYAKAYIKRVGLRTRRSPLSLKELLAAGASNARTLRNLFVRTRRFFGNRAAGWAAVVTSKSRIFKGRKPFSRLSTSTHSAGWASTVASERKVLKGANALLRWSRRAHSAGRSAVASRKNKSIKGRKALSRRLKRTRPAARSRNGQVVANSIDQSKSILFRRRVGSAISRTHVRYINPRRTLRISSGGAPTRVRSVFTNRVGTLRSARSVLSAIVLNRELQSKENSQFEGRAQLWRDLTSQWMKKERIHKGWLAEMKYLLTRGGKTSPWQLWSKSRYKLTRERVRKLEWREDDGRFERPDMYNAFRFFPNERAVAPWLEGFIYRRSTYFTQRNRYRRFQIPREHKRVKWLQQYRRTILTREHDRKYLRKRKWHTFRMYNQRLHRHLFSFRDSKAALKHFRKLRRRTPKDSGFAKLLDGRINRLDVLLVLLGIAPNIFWARVLALYGLIKVNNQVIYKPTYRLQPSSYLRFNLSKLSVLRPIFEPLQEKYRRDRLTATSVNFPKNFEYFPGVRTVFYKGLPRPEDIPANSRLNSFLFRMFELESGSGR